MFFVREHLASSYGLCVDLWLFLVFVMSEDDVYWEEQKRLAQAYAEFIDEHVNEMFVMVMNASLSQNQRLQDNGGPSPFLQGLLQEAADEEQRLRDVAEALRA